MARILVVEDDPKMRHLIQRILGRNSNSDHSIFLASDGAAGLAAIGDHDPQLVITDMELLGEVQGRQIIDAVRSLSSSVGLIAISGSHDQLRYPGSLHGPSPL